MAASTGSIRGHAGISVAVFVQRGYIPANKHIIRGQSRVPLIIRPSVICAMYVSGLVFAVADASPMTSHAAKRVIFSVILMLSITMGFKSAASCSVNIDFFFVADETEVVVAVAGARRF